MSNNVCVQIKHCFSKVIIRKKSHKYMCMLHELSFCGGTNLSLQVRTTDNQAHHSIPCKPYLSRQTTNKHVSEQMVNLILGQVHAPEMQLSNNNQDNG